MDLAQAAASADAKVQKEAAARRRARGMHSEAVFRCTTTEAWAGAARTWQLRTEVVLLVELGSDPTEGPLGSLPESCRSASRTHPSAETHANDRSQSAPHPMEASDFGAV